MSGRRSKTTEGRVRKEMRAAGVEVVAASAVHTDEVAIDNAISQDGATWNRFVDGDGSVHTAVSHNGKRLHTKGGGGISIIDDKVYHGGVEIQEEKPVAKLSKEKVVSPPSPPVRHSPPTH
jgi:hypothetical protein